MRSKICIRLMLFALVPCHSYKRVNPALFGCLVVIQACFRKHKTHATITQVLMHIFHNLVGHSIHCYHLQTASVQLNLPYYKFNLSLDLKQVWP